MDEKVKITGKRGGRPRKRSGHKVTHIKVHCTLQQQAQIRQLAAQLHTSQSEYLLRKGLGELHKLPSFRSLPTEVTTHLLTLKQLAGAFTLAALKSEKEVLQSQELKRTASHIRSLVYEIEQYLRER